jgi:hypothetical protein
MHSNNDLAIPVYLNQRLVFDLIAMLEGGIASVVRIAEAERSTSVVSSRAEGAFGLNAAFASLFKVSASGSLAGDAGDEVERTTVRERIHTPASLFHQLRTALHERSAIYTAFDEGLPANGDFVEFTATLSRSPLKESVESILKMGEFISVMAVTDTKDKKGKPASELEKTLGLLRSLADALNTGGFEDLVAGPLTKGLSAVLSVEGQYLNDPSMSDLVDGTFRVLGKVTRVVEKNAGSISLLRNTVLHRFPEGILQQLATALQGLSQHQFAMPEMKARIDGPVIQVLPIAIFT